MDHQKDNQHNGHDSKGQSNVRLFADVSNKESMSLNYISKKSEKLTTALYMVTDIMNDHEPMKWKLRESGVELLSDIMLAGASSSFERMSLYLLIEKKIEKVISFLDVAWTARMMSEMNASILKREYVAIKDTIEKEISRSAGMGGTVLHESFFNVPRELLKETSDIQKEFSEISKGLPVNSSRTNLPVREPQVEVQKDIQGEAQSDKDIEESSTSFVAEKKPSDAVRVQPSSNVHESKTEVSPAPSAHFVPESLRVNRQGSQSSQETSVHAESRGMQNLGVVRPDANAVARDDRRKIILALIKQKPSLTVKDIVKSIPGYSEKTIQRELLAMVGEGTLIKKGERRWSTYSLA